MARALWKGAISFGLVYVPVQLHSASRDSALKMHMLDRRDFAPVGYRRTNKRTSGEVAWQDIVKGYEYEKGKYVALSEGDFRAANLKASSTIDIATFTELGNIPPEYYETPYFLEPQKGGEKVYALLREAMLHTRRVAVATLVMHGRQHLAAVGADERTLKLNTLRFAEELRGIEGLEIPAKGARAAGLTAKELGMAEKLIEGMSAAFEPERYHDTYRADLLHRIEEKVRKGETHALAPEEGEEEPRTAQVIDLMSALRKSLESHGEARGDGKADARRPARAGSRSTHARAHGTHRKRA
ncbi:MAG TPA: Ku protein [Steroidobacteraceae bacterium]|jgi:DNA end-binding protein Ku